LYTSFIRWYHQEDRQKSYDFVKNVIERTLDIIELRLHKEEELNFCQSLIKDLLLAMSGLENLMYTYSPDENYVSSIQTLIETIDRRLQRYKREAPMLFVVDVKEVKEDNKKPVIESHHIPSISEENKKLIKK
jgi:hypothetical protein